MVGRRFKGRGALKNNILKYRSSDFESLSVVNYVANRQDLLVSMKEGQVVVKLGWVGKVVKVGWLTLITVTRSQ